MKTLEGNTLIDRFMFGVDYSNRFGPNYLKHLRYHSDWNELMLVVEKIGGIPIEEPDYKFSILNNDITLFSSIDKVWSAVIEFIEWDNKQP